jgi:hypothetical protein
VVEAAGVESGADIENIGVYEDLPNVYRLIDILMLRLGKLWHGALKMGGITFLFLS